MDLFTTKIKLKDSTDKDKVLAVLKTWLKGSPHYKIKEINYDGKEFFKQDFENTNNLYEFVRIVEKVSKDCLGKTLLFRGQTKKRKQKYIYTYWHQPDNIMHIHGVHSTEAKNEVQMINREIEKLCKKLKNSLVIITADHGQADCVNEYLEDYPVLTDMLKIPPSVEPRALSFFVKDGKADAFKEEFNKLFGDSFRLMTKEEVFAENLLGFGTAHNKTKDFIAEQNPDAIEEILAGAFEHRPELFLESGAADEFLNQRMSDLIDAMAFSEVAETVDGNLTHEDFSNRKQNYPKQDFNRKWNHTRTKTQVVSMSDVDDKYPAEDSFDIAEAKAVIGALPEEDRKILLLHIQGYTQKEIAKKLGYKTHSAVGKKLKKIKAQLKTSV